MALIRRRRFFQLTTATAGSLGLIRAFPSRAQDSVDSLKIPWLATRLAAPTMSSRDGSPPSSSATMPTWRWSTTTSRVRRVDLLSTC